MAERVWVPTEYLDEISPPGRSSPTDWIKEADGDCYKLAPVDDCEDAFFLTVKAGDVVGFHCMDDYGRAVIVVKPDGTYSVIGEVPPEADHFWIPGDPDTLAYSLDDFVKDNGLTLAEEYDTQFGMAWWSESVPHQLVVDADGAKFVQVTTQ